MSLRNIKFQELAHGYWFGWAAYFIALIAIAMLSSISTMEIWTQSLFEAANNQPWGDPKYFAGTAMDIFANGWITEKSHWTFNLWPPGFMLLEGWLLRLFGSNAPMPLILLAISSGIFAAIMMGVRQLLPKRLGGWTWLLPLVIFSFSEARFFLLSPLGLLLGEWLAIGCFFGAVLLLSRGTFRGMLLAGVLFATSAYARSQYEFFLNVMLLVSIMMMVVTFFWNKLEDRGHWKLSKYFFFSLIIAQTAMLPWRLYHLTYEQDMRWVYTGPELIKASLQTDEVLIARGAGFAFHGGVNVACHLSSEDCGKTDSETYLRIFFNHPREWVITKMQLLPEYWFVHASDVTEPKTELNIFEWLLDGALLLVMIGSWVLLWLARRSSAIVVWAGVSISLLGAHVAIVVFSHLEVRYFYFIKLYGVFSFITLVATVKGQMQRASSPQVLRPNEY